MRHYNKELNVNTDLLSQNPQSLLEKIADKIALSKNTGKRAIVYSLAALTLASASGCSKGDLMDAPTPDRESTEKQRKSVPNSNANNSYDDGHLLHNPDITWHYHD